MQTKEIVNKIILTFKYKSKWKKIIIHQQNQSNMQNPNKGSNGINKQYSQNHGNRGKQLNHNQKKK